MNSRRTSPSFRNLPSYRLTLLSSVSERQAESVYRKLHGLKLIECRIIAITGTHGEIDFRKLCEEAGLEKSYTSRIVKKLVAQGLLRKEENAEDQRTINITLTDAGARVRAQVHATEVKRNEEWTEVLTPEEKGNLLPLLEKLTDRLLAMQPSPGAETRPKKAPLQPRPAPSAVEELHERLLAIPESAARQLIDLLSAVLGEQGDRPKRSDAHPS